ncbi:MAG: hypothetical protein MUC81_03505 [Bacteroidia bacterium]|nr:hypothetical protein [Bacteroidia bacterium]
MTNKPIFIWVIDQFGSPQQTLANYNNDIITKNGFELRFWDVRGLHKGWYKQNKNFAYIDTNLDITMFSALEDIKQSITQLKKEKRDIFLLLSGKIAFWNRPFIKLIETEQLTYGVRRNRASFYDATTGKSSSKDAITSKTKKIINNLYSATLEAGIIRLGIKGPNFVFLGTKHDQASVNYPVSTKSIIYTHTKDYDRYLNSEDVDESLRNKVVFIDQYLPYHAETKHLGLNADLFYNEIVAFLNNICNIIGTTYIIAAHPAASVDVMKKHIDEEKLQYGNTLELLKYCKLAISINSSAALAAIICKKPILLIKSEKYHNSINNITDILAQKLSIETFLIENEIKKQSILGLLNNSATEKTSLFEEYIKQPLTAQKLEFDIICETINTHFKQLLQ